MAEEVCDKCSNYAIGKYDVSNITGKQFHFCEKHKPVQADGMKTGDERQVEKKVMYYFRMF